MIINQLFSNMWDLYSRINPQVIKVKKMFDERENKNVANDHIAIRTFNHPRVNRNVIAKSFLESGYEAYDDLKFEKKKLDATYYGHHDKNLTRVFISELRLEDFSEKPIFDSLSLNFYKNLKKKVNMQRGLLHLGLC